MRILPTNNIILKCQYVLSKVCTFMHLYLYSLITRFFIKYLMGNTFSPDIDINTGATKTRDRLGSAGIGWDPVPGFSIWHYWIPGPSF